MNGFRFIADSNIELNSWVGDVWIVEDTFKVDGKCLTPLDQNLISECCDRYRRLILTDQSNGD